MLIQNHVELNGVTVFIGKPSYKKYDTAPIKLQGHGDPSPLITFRKYLGPGVAITCADAARL
jgi:hypothetical protein